jgi:hypothetical protein
MNTLTHRAVGTFSDHKTTDIALHELKDRGFLMDKVSVIGRDIYHYPEFTGANTSDRLVNTGNLASEETTGRFVDAGNVATEKTTDRPIDLDTDENRAKETAVDGAIAGSTIGGVAGLLVGLGALAIPGVGPVMLAGAAATAIATAISGGVIGAAAGSLTGGLVGLGIPEDRAKIYDDRITEGGYLVIVEGSDVDINLAKSIFDKHDIHDWYIYDLSSKSVRPIV